MSALWACDQYIHTRPTFRRAWTWDLKFCGYCLEILNDFAFELVLRPQDNGVHAESIASLPNRPLPLSPPPPEMGSQSQLTTPLHPHCIATVALTLSRGLDRGLGNVRVKHAPRSVLGHSKVEALLPWPHGYHSTFTLSPTLDPDEGAS